MRKPMRYQTWTTSHASQATKPESLILPAWAMARERPIVAIEPLSR
ncbi:hypothetical protein AKJ09_11314 [Labilithrix luteola]|uniref:Uncharacterized protein n=1 Tax=Labilithrix luteola TaxID=1391654 RepID=A0A0K1QFU9_9BACT|nr:hypothetical protein AKJ09_11314 [Labilithrix luteola]